MDENTADMIAMSLDRIAESLDDLVVNTGLIAPGIRQVTAALNEIQREQINLVANGQEILNKLIDLERVSSGTRGVLIEQNDILQRLNDSLASLKIKAYIRL